MNERLEALFERVQDVLADMTPRDRMLLLGLTIFVALGVIGGVTFSMKSTLDGMQSRIDERAKNLEFVYDMAQQYADATATLAVLEKDLARNSNIDLSAFLEQACMKAQIEGACPDSVREKSTIQDGNLEEKVYTVSISNVSTQQLATLLYEAETAGFPMKIRSTKVKTRTRKGEKLLSVTMDISSFRAINAGGEG